MIKLERAPVPLELTPEEVERLTNEFVVNATPVWDLPFVKVALLSSSASKCAYCESKVDEESKYMEVEHFRCKSDFPDLVVSWENLLPSCKRCNGQKHAHNVDRDGMIIDPYSADPPRHLYLENYRLRPKDDLGRRTIETLYLNDSDRMVSVRFNIGETVATALENIRYRLEDYLESNASSRKRKQILRGLESLMDECQTSKEYSAVAASALLADPNFVWIKATLMGLDLWEDFDQSEQDARRIALMR